MAHDAQSCPESCSGKIQVRDCAAYRPVSGLACDRVIGSIRLPVSKDTVASGLIVYTLTVAGAAWALKAKLASHPLPVSPRTVLTMNWYGTPASAHMMHVRTRACQPHAGCRRASFRLVRQRVLPMARIMRLPGTLLAALTRGGGTDTHPVPALPLCQRRREHVGAHLARAGKDGEESCRTRTNLSTITQHESTDESLS